MDYDKLYGLDKLPPPDTSPALPPLDLTEATPVLLAKAIEAARKSTDPKVIIPVLDALLKRGHAEADKEKLHDIREVMKLLTDEQLGELEGQCKTTHTTV